MSTAALGATQRSLYLLNGPWGTTMTSAPAGRSATAANREARTGAVALLALALAIAFSYSFASSYFAPPMSDDLWIPFGRDGQGLHDVGDVFRSAFDGYQRHTMRLGTVALFAVLALGRWLWVLLNPLFFLAIGYLVFVLAAGRGPSCRSRADGALLLLVYLLLGGAAPAVTEACFWASGATVYLWGTVAVLAFLVPVRGLLGERPAAPDTVARGAAMLVAGVVVSQAGETIVPPAIALIGAYWLYSRLHRRPAPRWFRLGGLGITAGFAAFVLVPGRFERALGAPPESSLQMDALDRLVSMVPAHLSRFVGGSGRLLCWLFAAVAVMAALAAVVRRLRPDRDRPASVSRPDIAVAAALVVAAAASVASLFIVPTKVSARVYFSPGVLLIVGLVILARTLMEDRHWRPGRWVLGVVAFVCFMEMASITKEYLDIQRQTATRMALLAAARNSGQPVVVPVPLYRRPRQQHVWLRDITADPDHPWNRAFARYYGVTAVVGVADANQ